jgi:hypothetical protein
MLAPPGLPAFILLVGEEVLDPKSLVGEIDPGDHAIVVASNIENNVVGLHPVCR